MQPLPPFHVNILKYRKVKNNTHSAYRTFRIQPQETRRISRHPFAHSPSPTVTMHPIFPLHMIRPVNHAAYPNLEEHIRTYKVSNPSICSHLYSTSIQVYPLTRIEQTQHLINTRALLTRLNCTHITHIKDEASEINLRTIPKPDMPSPN